MGGRRGELLLQIGGREGKQRKFLRVGEGELQIGGRGRVQLQLPGGGEGHTLLQLGVGEGLYLPLPGRRETVLIIVQRGREGRLLTMGWRGRMMNKKLLQMF